MTDMTRCGVVAALLAALVHGAAEGQRRGGDDEPVRVGFTFGFGPTYNRVEGLSLSGGPVIETTGDHPFRFEGRLIVRVEQDLPTELDQVGFDARAEQVFGEDGRFAVGATGWSKLSWVEDGSLSHLEASLGAFVFHDDRRDYYDGKGFSVYGRYGPRRSPLRAVAAFVWEDQAPINNGGISSLFDSRASWRPEPLAAEGVFRSLIGLVSYDTRPRRRTAPFNGWWAQGQVMKGIGGDLRVVVHTDFDDNPIVDSPEPDNQLAAGFLDIRRYNTVGDLAVNLRLVAGGTLKDSPLPPQFQHALGGDGTIPGAGLFRLDCGARESRIRPLRSTLRTEFFPYYGCDRHALFQVDVIGYFGFRIGREGTRSAWEGPGFDFDLIPQWALFFDAGKGWSRMDPARYAARDEDLAYDVGAGILLGDLGAYGAYGLSGENKTVRFVLRLVRRI